MAVWGHQNENKYEHLNVFHKKTGKSYFKDYELLLESHEARTMVDIYALAEIHMMESQPDALKLFFHEG